MIESTSGVPPHIALLLNESFDLSSPRNVVRKLKGMLPDLKAQADSCKFESLPDLGDEPGVFRAVLSGGLDLFHGHGACQFLVCRVGYAVNLSRSIALMADQVTMHDYFRENIQALRTRATHRELTPLAADVYVLTALKPLVEAGLVRFISPLLPTCSGCMGEFDRRVEALTSQVMMDFSSGCQVDRSNGLIAVDTGNTYTPHIVFRYATEFAKDRSDSDLMNELIQTAIRSAMWDARNASFVGGAVFSNSSAGLNALIREDGRSMTSSAFRAFAGQRAADLPWVDGLSIQQTLDLRDAASSALPSLREFLARRMSARSTGADACNWDDCVAELREQAQQVRGELTRATSRSPSLRRNAAGILGLGVSAVSFASEGPVAGLSTLLGTLGLMHSIPGSNGVHAESLRSKPGYVLVAAEDILSHST